MVPILLLYHMHASERPGRSIPRRGSRVLFALAAVVTSGSLCAQHVTVAVSSKSRPLYEAIQQIQKLTAIPINYEDLQYNYAGDFQDIGSQMTPVQMAKAPNPKVLVPKGGSFSVDVPVDPATGKLPDALSVRNALNLVISAAQGVGAVPGTFRVDSSPGMFFVEPASHHDANGAAAAAEPVFDTPITVSFQQTIARQVLDAIFQQVQQKTGFRFTHGGGTLALSAPSKVSISAANEPAKYVLARLLGAVYYVPPGTPPVPVSYLALFEPQFRYYAFNMQLDTAAWSPPKLPSPPTLAPTPGSGWPNVKKTN